MAKEVVSRASWNIPYEKGLVDILHEHNTPNFRGQNGWVTNGWRQIVSKFNEKFPLANFFKQQIQEKEKELKGNYKVIRDARKQSGTGWDESLGMIIAEPKIWDKLIADFPKLKKFRNKAFPHFNNLALLYEGSVATGDLNFTSLPKGDVTSDKASLGDDGTIEPDASKNPFADIMDDHREVVGEAEPHSSSTSSAHMEEHTGKKRKQSQIAGVLEDYLDYRKKQTQKLAKKLDSPKKDDKYSFAKCWTILDTMDEVTDQEKARAMKVLKCPMNRELFIEANNPTVRLFWLRDEISS